jgi:hypothetical protein
MSDFLSQIRKWVGLDKNPTAKQVSGKDLERAEGEGMSPPDVETPSPHVEDPPEAPRPRV